MSIKKISFDYLIENWGFVMQEVRKKKEENKEEHELIKDKSGTRVITIVSSSKKEVENKTLKQKIWWKILCILEWFDRGYRLNVNL